MKKNVIILIMLLLAIQLNADDLDSLRINEFMALNIASQLTDDYSDFSDWIELYNSGSQSVSLSGLYLTDKLDDHLKWKIPDWLIIPANGYITFWADGKDIEQHTNFKLSDGGEAVGLFRADGTVVDTVTYQQQYADISYGRYPNGSDNWQYFNSPTWRTANFLPGSVSSTRADSPVFSQKSGFFQSSIHVALTSETGTAIYYTLDGSFPDTSSIFYTVPITIDTTTVVRARSFSDSMLMSTVVTHSYLFDENTELPVISIATDPYFLFDDSVGITLGINVPVLLGSPPPFDPNANFWHKWERPVHIEYFDTSGVCGFSQDAGLRLFGGAFGRQIVQKAFSLYARNKYGDSDFDYPLFSTKPMKRYKRFLLRASSNDYNRTFFRDGMMNTLVIGQMDIDYMAYEPAIVYINGVFWGIYNIREKMNEFYPESNHGIDKDNVDLLEGTGQASAGTEDHYQNLLTYIRSNDLSNDIHYNYVKSMIDITGCMNYFIAQIYFRNHDWLHQNIKFWREQSSTGKYRWLLYDTDWGFGGEVHEGEEQYTTNSIAWAQNQGEASDFLVNLLKNDNFKNEFAQRMITHLNLTFNPHRVLQIIETLMMRIFPEMERQVNRWGAITDMAYWEEQIEVLREFARERSGWMITHLYSSFELPDTTELIVEVSDPMAGYVKVMDTPVPVPIDAGPWFKNIPIKLQAVARAGYKFSGWHGNYSVETDTVTISITDTTWMFAVFEASSKPSLVISEIHYNASKTLQGIDDDYEFIELINTGSEKINLTGWQFNKGLTFTFPANSYINPAEAVVIASNKATYENNGYQVFQFTDGSLTNSGEKIWLVNSTGMVMDSVDYDDQAPWATTPDGDGPSLELRDLLLDNGVAANWQASSEVGGTPGDGPGSTVVESTVIPQFYELYSNYPNPFNPVTNIKFSIPGQSYVEIKVYNLKGQLMEVLLQKEFNPGTHIISWDASDMTSGIYFIKMDSGEFYQIQKCLLVK
ncbi:CotH kinase family protein [bacterium]|nr:CotH kinase family protein [bacterium]